MKPKKHPKKDLNLKRGLYFVIGLLLILLLIYVALEWKTSENNGGYDLGLGMPIETI
jgi:protein TonB